jgi:hypothetical protein
MSNLHYNLFVNAPLTGYCSTVLGMFDEDFVLGTHQYDFAVIPVLQHSHNDEMNACKG